MFVELIVSFTDHRLTVVVTLKDENTNERVDDRKASGRIPHNLEILVNLGHSIAEDNTIRQFRVKRLWIFI